MKRLTGIVLCGGKSSRMGEDKGTMVKDWQTWSQRTEDLFLTLKIPACISVNPRQLPVYKKYHREEAIIPDAVNAKGPLTGILSAHRAFPDHDLMVVACDMVHMQLGILEELLTYYKLKPGAEVFAFAGEFLEPLCAIYKASFLTKVMDQLEKESLVDFSMHKIAESSNLCKIDLTSYQDPFFKNFNYKKDVYEQPG